jgi:hypothetical protein
MASKLSEQRTAAVKALHARVAPAPEHVVSLPTDDIVAGIRELAPLGRAGSRWAQAVESWARFIEAETAEDASRKGWSYLQGSVFFSHQVEGL